MKKEGYKIRSTMFKGSDKCGYTYEITFNKSLEHTGRYTGIEQGLDAYVKKETSDRFKNSFKNVWDSFVDWIKSL